MKDIPGYEGLYALDEDGSVWSYPKVGSGKHDGKFLKHGLGVYRLVRLVKEKKIKTVNVHRLLALMYIPNPNNYPVVMHKDNNKYNCALDNLMWGTYKQNSGQASRDGLFKFTERGREVSRKQGIKNGKPIKQYTLDGVFVREFRSSKNASEITGISYGNICTCRLGRKGRGHAGGFIWK